MRASTRKKKKHVTRALICVLPYTVDLLSHLLFGSLSSEVKIISCYLPGCKRVDKKVLTAEQCWKVCHQNCCVRQWVARQKRRCWQLTDTCLLCYAALMPTFSFHLQTFLLVISHVPFLVDIYCTSSNIVLTYIHMSHSSLEVSNLLSVVSYN